MAAVGTDPAMAAVGLVGVRLGGCRAGSQEAVRAVSKEEAKVAPTGEEKWVETEEAAREVAEAEAEEAEEVATPAALMGTTARRRNNAQSCTRACRIRTRRSPSQSPPGSKLHPRRRSRGTAPLRCRTRPSIPRLRLACVVEEEEPMEATGVARRAAHAAAM